MAQTRPLPTLSRGFTRLGRFLAPYDIESVPIALFLTFESVQDEFTEEQAVPATAATKLRDDMIREGCISGPKKPGRSLSAKSWGGQR